MAGTDRRYYYCCFDRYTYEKIRLSKLVQVVYTFTAHHGFIGVSRINR